MVKEKRTLTVFGVEISSAKTEEMLISQGRVLIFILMGMTLFNYLYNGFFRPFSTDKFDFNAYYNAAIAMKHGYPLYDLMIKFFKEGLIAYKGPVPYVYPPIFAIFLSPLALMSYRQAAVFWLFLNHFLFITGFVLLIKTIKRRYSLVEISTLIFICFNYTPLFIDYLIGQSNIILFFFITLSFYFFRENKDVYAGTILAIPCIIKVIPLLLVMYFLWKRHYAVFISAVIAMLFLFFYSLIFFDAELYLWYFKFMIHENTFAAFHDNHSLTGFFSRFLIHTEWVKGLINSPFLAHTFILLSSVFLAGCFFYVTRRRVDRSDDRTLREFGLALITMLLVSKMTSTPYLVMLLVPIVILFHELFHGRQNIAWILLGTISYGILAVWYPLAVGKFLNMDVYTVYTKGITSTVFSIQFFALVALWCYFLCAKDRAYKPVDVSPE